MGIIAVMWTLAPVGGDIKWNNLEDPAGVVKRVHSSGSGTPIDPWKSPDRLVLGTASQTPHVCTCQS
jgi:hypothetical protein